LSKIDVKEVEAALATGEDLSELTEDTGKHVKKFKDFDDKPKPRKKKKPRAPKLALVEITAKEVPKMVKSQKQTKPSPFGQALYSARQLTTRRPEEEQPEVLTTLSKAMAQLDENDKRKLVFRLQKEYLEDKCQASGLFAAAREAKMRAVAVSAVAVKRTGLTFSGLLEVGIAKIVLGKDNKPHTSYSTGAENLAAAAKILRRQGKIAPAQVLEAYLSRNERERALREAAKAETGASDESGES